MPLTGPQLTQIHQAILAAYTRDDLRRMLAVDMHLDFDAVVPDKAFSDQMFALVTWADQHGRVADLIAGALCQNPDNPGLQSLAAAVQSWHIEAPAPAAASPYKGLAFYDVADAPLFFGRETLTAELVDYLKDHRFLAIVGASGSGKSSVVRAGVVAALRKGEIIKGSEKWPVFVVTPTARPLTTLAAVLIQDAESVNATTTLIDERA